MDFPSISHERALELGIEESAFGIKIKELERQNIDYAISCSNFARDSYNGLTSAKKHFSIWLGTNFKTKNTNNLTIENVDKLHICCLANTEKRKGIDILIEAFNKIDLTHKKLYLIGRINPNWVKFYCNKNKLSAENIILTGPIPQQDLKEFLLDKDMDLHILPSRFDSFGMVVPETMALGIPNIVSPFVGAGEMLAHEKDGFILQSLNTDELTATLNTYLNMTCQEKSILRQSAWNKSKEMTWNQYTKRVNSVFKEIISSL